MTKKCISYHQNEKCLGDQARSSSKIPRGRLGCGDVAPHSRPRTESGTEESAFKVDRHGVPCVMIAVAYDPTLRRQSDIVPLMHIDVGRIICMYISLGI